LKPLETPLNYLDAEGKNPRYLERRQLVQLMKIYTEELIVGRWDSDKAIAKLEYKVQQGASKGGSGVARYDSLSLVVLKRNRESESVFLHQRVWF
jgi:hypothetical protein